MNKHENCIEHCKSFMEMKDIKVRAKNCGKGMPQRGTFYRTDLTIEDAKGFKVPVYCRNLPQWHVDIPIGSNDLGMIWKGRFIWFGIKAHPYTLDARDALKKRSDYLKENNKSIIQMAKDFIKTHSV